MSSILDEDHGARHLVFLSRSGSYTPEAKSLVEEPQKDSKITVKVTRGDVHNPQDV